MGQAELDYNEARYWEARLASTTGEGRLLEWSLALPATRFFIEELTTKVGGEYVTGSWGTDLIELLNDELPWKIAELETPRLMAEITLTHFEREKAIKRMPIGSPRDVAPMYRWSETDRVMNGRSSGPLHPNVGTYVAHWWVAYGAPSFEPWLKRPKHRRVWPAGEWG